MFTIHESGASEASGASNGWGPGAPSMAPGGVHGQSPSGGAGGSSHGSVRVLVLKKAQEGFPENIFFSLSQLKSGTERVQFNGSQLEKMKKCTAYMSLP